MVRGDTTGLLPQVARLGLRLAAIPYGWAIRLRNRGYDRHPRRSHRVDCTVVSIGNLTVGGTGKTPMVEWLTNQLLGQDLKVCLLSRGYKARLDPATGKRLLNDEGLVLACNLPGVPHLQGLNRVENARLATAELRADVIVLDDGFQHRRLHRDCDIVLIDATDPFGGGRLLPAGLLREPMSELRRADCVVITRADQVAPHVLLLLRTTVGQLIDPKRNCSMLASRFRPITLVNSIGDSTSLLGLRGKRIGLFSGIGNPAGFVRTASELGVQIVGQKTFADHFSYDAVSIADIEHWASELRPDLLLTTQKDLVKIGRSELSGIPLHAIRIGVEFLDSPQPLLDRIAREVRSRTDQSANSRQSP